MLHKAVKIIVLLCAALVILAAVLGGALLWSFNYLSQAPETPPVQGLDESIRVHNDQSVTIEVHEGDSAYSVGRRLEQAGIIRSHYIWDILARLDSGNYLKAGVYQIELPARPEEIRAVLVEGKQELIRVTIPEGVTLKKTAQLLAAAHICDADAFLAAASDVNLLDEYRVGGDTMEGYLYPDTYFFEANYPAEKVLRYMADAFYTALENIPLDGTPGKTAADLSPDEIYEKTIIASIVEREYRDANEAPLMAGVFYNRLRIGMALQSCATVEYVITDIEGKPHPTRIYAADLEINNPYNTYQYAGLPPGPISEPGLVALRAAFNPAQTPNLYFRLVNPNEGRHYFSTTFDEHIRAAGLYTK
jgi:UPF0755 protein